MMKTKKIDIFFRGNYIASTTKFQTCNQAKKYYLDRYYNQCIKLGLPLKDISGLVRCNFDKEYKNED